MILIAQSLDNEGPLIVAVDRCILDPSDPSRGKLIDLASKTAGRGTVHESLPSAVIYSLNDFIAVKVYPPMQDSEGRHAPIIGCEELANASTHGWPSRTLESLKWFSNETGRPLDEESEMGILSALEVAQSRIIVTKKNSRRIILVLAGIFILLLAMILSVSLSKR